MKTVNEKLEAIQKSAASHSSDVRMIRTLQVGKHVRQGDIYVERMEATPAGLPETEERQLAPGTSKGSRHVVAGRVRVYRRTGDALVGPVIDASERFEVSHPEHADLSMPSGCYSVTYQRDFAREERARVED